MSILFVGIGGALGAITRYLISLMGPLFLSHHFPVFTLVANTLGCFIAGLIFAKTSQAELSTPVYQGIVIGFLGALTTFSTFTVQTMGYVENAQFSWALFNIVGSVLICFTAFYLGRFF